MLHFSLTEHAVHNRYQCFQINMLPPVAFQVRRGASSMDNIMGLIRYESEMLNFYCEFADQTLIVWPKTFGQVTGVHRLGETSVGVYAPIEVTGNIYKVSLWPLEVLKHCQTFISEVNPHARKIYGLFNMKDEMPRFMKSEKYRVLRLRVCVTEGLLLSPAFMPPSGVHRFKSTELALNCHPDVGAKVWKLLLEISNNDGKSGDLRVKMCLQKQQWWEMTVNILFDSSDLPKVTSILSQQSLTWTESVIQHEVHCIDQNNKWIKAINHGLECRYGLTGEHSAVRDCVDGDLPQVFATKMLAAARCGFDADVTMIGLPPAPLWPPIGDLVFATFLVQDDFWIFLNDTQDDRKMELYETYGIVFSAVLSKVDKIE